MKRENVKREASNSASAPKNTFYAVNRDVPVLGDLREDKVEHDDGDEAGDERFGAGAAHPRCAAAAGEAFVAADECDGRAEKDALDQAFENLPVVDAHGRVAPIG